MTLNCGALGPKDQNNIRKLEPVILATMRRASYELGRGNGGAFSTLWFGDASAGWIRELGSTIRKFSSAINLNDVTINFMTLADHDPEIRAAANPPANGWGVYTNTTVAFNNTQVEAFLVELDVGFGAVPDYRAGGIAGQSKFKTLVHELSHVFIHTEDYARDVADCQTLAVNNPANAKMNADSWGFFMEEFRV